jgi:hypothetical protein
MTTLQIFNEVKLDSFVLVAKVKQFTFQFLQKSKDSYTFEYTSSRNNTYQVIFTTEKSSIGFYVLTKISTDFGRKWIALMINHHKDKLDGIQIINPHVIDRFKERNNYNGTSLDAFCQLLVLLRESPTMILDENKNPISANQPVVPCKAYSSVTQIECGVIFGEVAFTDKNTNKGIAIQTLKTFLPNNMLNKNQQELNDLITANDAR